MYLILEQARRLVMSFEKIRDIIVEQLNVEPSMVTMDTNLMKDLEADSLDAVEIIMAIEEEFDIEIPDEEAENFQVVSDLVGFVDDNIE
jgi:acyl carrier protein